MAASPVLREDNTQNLAYNCEVFKSIMTCLEARKCIYDYLNNKLSDEKLQEFMEHISGCDECMEELRITHMVYSGVQKLDAVDDSNLNIDGSFRRQLMDTRFYLFRIHAIRIIRMAADSVVFWAVLVTLLLQLRIWFL